MVKIMFLLKRKDGLTPEQFRTYYEENHAPLARRLLPLYKEYSRNFIQHDSEFVPPHMRTSSMDFDVITEITFEAQADLDRHNQMLTDDPALAAELSADEEKFIDRDASVFFIVERETTPPDVLAAERQAFAQRLTTSGGAA